MLLDEQLGNLNRNVMPEMWVYFHLAVPLQGLLASAPSVDPLSQPCPHTQRLWRQDIPLAQKTGQAVRMIVH